MPKRNRRVKELTSRGVITQSFEKNRIFFYEN
jgi:hypothetical protein